MKYMVMLLGSGSSKDWTEMTPEEQGEALAQHDRFDRACAERDGVEIISGEALADGTTATVMRTAADGKVTLTEGPYAEAIEGFGGFYVVDAPDLDVLVELLKELPAYDIEIRPTADF